VLFRSENWDTDQLPASGDDVVIPGGNFVRLINSTNVNQLHIEQGAELRMVSNSNVPNAITDFHGNLVVDGQLTVRGEVNLFGSVDIGVTGKLLGQAWMNTPGFPQTIDPGQLFLGVNGDIENQGEIALLSEATYYGFAQEIQLTMNEGFTLHNTGTISIERPHHDQSLPFMRHQVLGNVVNDGHVQADFNFSSNGGHWINRGTIQVADYFFESQQMESTWEMRGGTYVYDGGTISGTGTIESDQLTFQVDQPYLHVTGNLPEVFYNTEITGTETFTIPEGSGTLFSDTDIDAPFRLDGWATFRGGSKIDGELFVSPTGILNVEAYVPPGGHGNYRFFDNSYLTITNGFTNFGEIIIWSRESSYTGGTQWGHVAHLTVQNGPIINDGVIRTQAPVAELPINPFLSLSAEVINHGQFIVEGRELRISPGSLTSDGEVLIHEGVRLIHNAGSYVQNGGTTRIERTSIEGSQGDPYEFNGGTLVGDGRVYIPSRVNGVVAPGFEPPFSGQSIGSLFLELEHQYVLSSGVIEIDVQGGNAGEYDTVRFSDLPINQGTLRLQTDPSADLPIGTTITPVTVDYGTVAPFPAVEGRLIDDTKAWSLPTLVNVGFGMHMELTVIELDEATLTEILIDEFNVGISRTAASLPDWFDASDDGLPGKQQGLGSSLRSGINSAATSIFPPITNTVTTLNDLRSELTSLGYSVECLQGDAACGTDMFRVGAANGTTGFNHTTTSDPGALAGLSLVPAGVDLGGDLNWDGTLSTSNVTFGFGAAGFYLDQNAQFDLSVTGGGDVTDAGISLSTGGLSIDFDGTVTVPATKPVAASISLSNVLDGDNFSADPYALFVVTSSGEAQLDVTHTLQPTGLTYDGVWQLRQDTSGTTPTLVEISGNVDYPTTDDWLASSLGVLGAAFNVLLGAEATDKFNQLALPLIADSQPADSAPNLIGINSSEFESAESSWMDKLFGGVKSIFSFFEEDDPATGGQGAFGTKGDVLINAHTLRHEEQVDGSGVKVGVISTGADGLLYAQGTGDIPGPAQLSTFIDQQKAFGGNGTAMLEIIHDIAPGADLAFASATDTRSFFDAVTWLTDIQNVDIIVSDVIDYTAPMFGSGAVAAFVQDVLRRKNVLFVQAAGNDGQKAVRDQLQLINVDDNGNTRRLHQFGGTPTDPVTTLPVTIAPESVVRVVLQTNQPYNNPTARIVAGVAALPNGVELNRIGFPLGSTGTRDHEIPLTVDSFTLANHGDSPIAVDVLIESIGGDLPAGVTPLFQMVVLGDATLPATDVGSLFGVALLDDVLVVGANEVSAPQQPAAYSSEGFPLGRHVDVVAPAGVETSGFGRRIWSDFHGTSSSAAHAAAAAAMLMQWAPAATTLEVREALKSTAKPLGTGVDDLRSGHGQIDVLEAASSLIRIPDPGIPGPPPGPGLLDKLTALPIISSISLPTEQQLQQLLSGGEVLLAGLLEMRLTVNESLGVFKAEYPFDFTNIGSFDQFEISGQVGLEAKPDINLQLGWDVDGWYIDVDSARIATDITGVGTAQGTVFDAFGVGAGATITGRPSIDVAAIDRAGDGAIRQDDINQLSSDLQGGDLSLVIPKLDTVDADLYGDVILGFLDYVDIDRNLRNRPNGGDPFIIRGRAKFNADFTGPQLQWSFGDFQLANPDIDGDETADYTLGALAQNAILFGEKLINAIELPGFVNDLLGGVGLGDDRNETPYDRPRGMLPDDPPEAPEAAVAKQNINTHVQTALAANNNDGSSVDQETLRSQIGDEMSAWLEGPPTALLPGEGEDVSGPTPIIMRFERLGPNSVNPIVDDALTAVDEYEIELNLALASYTDWVQSLQIANLTAEDVASPAILHQLETSLVAALRFAIQRAHAGAIQLHLDGAPLTHQYSSQQVNGELVQQVTQRGVFDRAFEAIRWAQTAEYLGLADSVNGLSTLEVLDELVIRANLDRAELVFPDPAPEDGFVGPEELLNLEVETTWQIKTPAGGTVEIDQLDNYDFGAPIVDSSGYVEAIITPAGNNNVLAGDVTESRFDPLSGLPLPPDAPPIVGLRTDTLGRTQTSMVLGEGDNQAQLEVALAIRGIPLASKLTNTVAGRPTIELLAIVAGEDDSRFRKDDLFADPGQGVTLRATIRRGNGPARGETLSFYLDGQGTIDPIDDPKAVHSLSDADGSATITYVASENSTKAETVGVSFFLDGVFYRDTVDIVPTNATGLSGYQISPPFVSQPPSGDQAAVDARQSISDALADAEFANIEQTLLDELTTKVTTWKSIVAQKADDAFLAAQDLNTADEVAVAMVSAAVSDYFDWLSYATLIEQGDVLAEEAIEAKLLGASDQLTRRFLSQFDGSAAGGGLDPLYDALEWATTVEHLLSLRAVPIAGDFLNPDDVIEQSGIKVELLPPISTSTSVQPLLTGPADDATLHVAARLVRQIPGGGVVPVMQSGDIPAPVEIRVLPYGQADIELNLPDPQRPAIVFDASTQ
ncbi:MAG: S8 family serine peptidase, partial [Planctomycetales bacterium]|nr:S8 family serine peptidase [Planctomycetales bacterium]